VILIILAAVWEIYARWLNNPLIFPAFSDMATSLWDATVRGPLIERTLTTIRVLLMGYVAGIALAMVIIIALLIESVVFRTVETHTVRKWGMQR
jgi:NitT/TauT family transport system permease protein